MSTTRTKPEDINASTQIVFDLYRTEIEQSRHHDLLRSNISGFINALAAALIAAISFKDQITASDWPLGAVLIVLGCFGAMVSLKHYERARKHGDRAGVYRREGLRLNELQQIDELKRQSDLKHRGQFSTIEKVRLYTLWLGLFAFHATIGIYVVVASFTA